MTKEVLMYCLRAIVQSLNGDFQTFYKYSMKATDMYKKMKFEESCIYPIKEAVPSEVQEQLYRMVS